MPDREITVTSTNLMETLNLLQKKKKWFVKHVRLHWNSTLRSWKKLFYFTVTFIMEISSYMILHLHTTLTTSLTCRKNCQTIYSTEKQVQLNKLSSSGISVESYIMYFPNVIPARIIVPFCWQIWFKKSKLSV